MPDIFVSYRRSDCQSEAFALHQALLRHFHAEQIFLDTSRIEPGAVWSDRLTEAVQDSKVMLVLIGPKWLKAQDEQSGTRRLDDPDDWVRRELSLALSKDMLVIPLLFNQVAMPKAEYLPVPLQALPGRQFRALRAGEWPSDFAWVLETIGQRVERLAENKATIISSPTYNRQLTPPPPAPPPHFTGREEDLTALHDALSVSGKSCLLLTCGTGGIGKTTLATAYFSRYGDHFRHCAWVDCPTENALNGIVESSLGTLFRSPNEGVIPSMDRHGQFYPSEGPDHLATDDSPQKRFQRIRQGLAGLEGPNLLIIDNANEPNSIREIYAQLLLPNWSVLVTTRAELSEFPHRNVQSLPSEEAREYFCSLYPPAIREPALLTELLMRTGCHTLTLEVLAKTLATQPSYSFPRLMEDLQRKGLTGILRHTATAIGWRNRKLPNANTPAALLRIVFDIARLSHAERDLLTAWAVLPSVHIPYSHLRAIMPVRENYHWWKITIPDRWMGMFRSLVWLPGWAMKWTSAEFDTLVDSLASKGWLEFEPEEKSWKLHQVVRDLVLARRKWQPFARLWKPMVHNMVTMLRKMNETEASAWLPYGHALAEYVGDKYSRSAWLSDTISTTYKNLGNPDLALTFRIRSIKGERWSLNFSNLATDNIGLGDLFRIKGKKDQAYKCYRRSLLIRRIQCLLNPFSKGSAGELATTYQRLGSFFRDNGDLTEAERFLKKDHKIRLRLLSKKPKSEQFKDNLGISFRNLGFLYQAQENLDKAKEHYQKALNISLDLVEKNLESEVFKIGMNYSLRLLGTIHTMQGDFDGADGYLKKSLEIAEALAIKNPASEELQKILNWSCFQLGFLYRKKNELEEATIYYQKRLAIVQAQTAKHPGSEWWNCELYYSNNALGDIYLQTEGGVDEAGVYYKKGLEIIRNLSILNPDSEKFQQHLSWSYRKLGRLNSRIGKFEEATEYYQKIIALSNAQNILYPESKWWQDKRAEATNSIGFAQLVAGQLHSAKPLFEQGVAMGLLHHNMNLGHLKLIEQDEPAALELYRLSLENFTDKNDFWEGMEDDFQHLTQYGITRPQYAIILAKLRAENG